MPLMMTKLRNAFHKQNPELVVELKNIRINGDPRGCSGFITNLITGRVVYVTTERSPYGPLQGKMMYRTARDTKDYSGGMNRWSTVDEFVPDVLDLLSKPVD